jgi:hypothetical protein
MSNARSGEQLENLTVDEILNLGVDDIEELKGFVPLPPGLYSGTLINWDMPSNDNGDSFVPNIQVMAVVELENPADAETVVINEETKISTRYGQKVPMAIQAMRTNWENFFRQVGNGNLGAAMANGPGAQIVFRVEHRYQTKENGVKLPKPKGPYLEIRS